MIERGHAHHLQPVAKDPRPDGSVQFHSKCVCGLEEQRVFDAAGRPTGIRYRFGGLWFAPLDLLRMLPLPVEICAACDGSPPLPGGCGRCGNLGVETAEGLGLIASPELSVLG